MICVCVHDVVYRKAATQRREKKEKRRSRPEQILLTACLPCGAINHSLIFIQRDVVILSLPYAQTAANFSVFPSRLSQKLPLMVRRNFLLPRSRFFNKNFPLKETWQKVFSALGITESKAKAKFYQRQGGNCFVGAFPGAFPSYHLSLQSWINEAISPRCCLSSLSRPLRESISYNPRSRGLIYEKGSEIYLGDGIVVYHELANEASSLSSHVYLRLMSSHLSPCEGFAYKLGAKGDEWMALAKATLSKLLPLLRPRQHFFIAFHCLPCLFSVISARNFNRFCVNSETFPSCVALPSRPEKLFMGTWREYL